MNEMDIGHKCGPNQGCTVPNIFCGYPDCYKGRRELAERELAERELAEREPDEREPAEREDAKGEMPEYADLMKKLRDKVRLREMHGLTGRTLAQEHLQDEAADAIESLSRRLREAEDVLRSLASWVSSGGYNAGAVDAKQFERKIRDGIDAMLRVEKGRRTAVEAELAAVKEELARANEQIKILCHQLNKPEPVSIFSPRCNCANYQRGQLTSGWHCPVHGQQW